MAPEPEPEAEGYKTEINKVVNIVFPSIAFIMLILAGLGLLWILTYHQVIKHNVKRWTQQPLAEPNAVGASEDDGNPCVNGDSFYSAFDLEVLQFWGSYHNRPLTLLRISLPAFFTILLCPSTIYMYQPLVDLFWTDNARPPVNDAIACFLLPAGLVYATIFGFAFQQAVDKQKTILQDVKKRISMIDHLATFIAKVKFPTDLLKRKMYRCVKTEALNMVLQVIDKEPEDFENRPGCDVKVKIWCLVDILYKAEVTITNRIDKKLCDNILKCVFDLNSICSDRMGILHSHIHPVKWLFLIILGFFSFLGILLVDAQSDVFELVICFITAFSISCLCYIVADIDHPFSGYFRISLSALWETIHRLELMHNQTGSPGEGTLAYPSRNLLEKIHPMILETKRTMNKVPDNPPIGDYLLDRLRNN